MLQATKNKVILVPVIDEAVTASGIVLMKPEASRVIKAKVISVGPEAYDIKVDDIALIPKSALIKVDDLEVVVLKDSEILAVLE